MRIFFTLLFLSIISLGFAQDQVFSQFYAAPLQMNPAMVGNTYAPRLSLNYRNQWPAFNQAYVSYAAAYDQYFEKANSSIGFFALSDVAGNGIYKTNQASLFYAYNLKLADEFYLKGGFEAGYVQNRLDWDQLIFLDQIDPITGYTDAGNNPFPSFEQRPDNPVQGYLDFGAGLLAYNKYVFGGFSLKHINSPDESILDGSDRYADVPVRMTFHGGGEITIKEERGDKRSTFVSPNAMLTKQGEFYQINGGAYIGSGLFFGGVWYRHAFSNSDAVIFLGGIEKGIFKVGYSYDYTISDLNTYTGGAHEVSLILNLDNSEAAKQRRRSRRFGACPRLFN